MPPLRAFIPKLGKNHESICSQCCQVIRVTAGQSLEEAQSQHRCGEFSLNTIMR
jgi:PHP family Zn ribbon phosphoesterase